LTSRADRAIRCAMPARSPNRKRAVAYLAACGASPITITERDGIATIHTGKIIGTSLISKDDRRPALLGEMVYEKHHIEKAPRSSHKVVNGSAEMSFPSMSLSLFRRSSRTPRRRSHKL
jgi:hypothetical protein